MITMMNDNSVFVFQETPESPVRFAVKPPGVPYEVFRSSFPTKLFSEKICTREELPNPIFSGALKFDPTRTKVSVDCVKAVEIKLWQFRKLRAPKLEALDVELIRSMEDTSKTGKVVTAEIIAKKKTLRDVTKVELPSDHQELASFIPEILK